MMKKSIFLILFCSFFNLYGQKSESYIYIDNDIGYIPNVSLNDSIEFFVEGCFHRYYRDSDTTLIFTKLDKELAVVRKGKYALSLPKQIIAKGVDPKTGHLKSSSYMHYDSKRDGKWFYYNSNGEFLYRVHYYDGNLLGFFVDPKWKLEGSPLWLQIEAQ